MSSPEYLTPPSVETLYRDHHDWLHGWLRRRLGNAADAADLAHDAFLRLLGQPRPFHNKPQARTYLRTMAGGLCVDLWRRREIEQAWLEELATRPEALVPSAEHQAMVLQALHEIDAMLRRLPARAASAFVMAISSPLTEVQIGQQLGVSARMVRKYVAQAMLHCLQLEVAHLVQENTSNTREALAASLPAAQADDHVGR